MGDGLAFVHAGGTIIQKELQPGEMLKLDTGCLVAMSARVNYYIAFAVNIKIAILGFEGLVLATLQGPGHVWLQSLPFSRFANRILAASKKGSSGSNSGEGGLIGNIGLKNLMGRD